MTGRHVLASTLPGPAVTGQIYRASEKQKICQALPGAAGVTDSTFAAIPLIPQSFVNIGPKFLVICSAGWLPLDQLIFRQQAARGRSL